MFPSSPLDRRALLRGSGLLGAGALLAPASLLGARQLVQGIVRPHVDSRVLGPVPGMPVPSCALAPSLTEGPFHFDSVLFRRDMTEGRAGLPLFVKLQVVRVSGCTPVTGAVVELWHCDANGLYSGYAGQLNNTNTEGDNFLRGMQTTDGNGDVTFQTVYPGWYPGRTVHIHVKVYVGGREVVTSQLYFPDDVSDIVLNAAEAYSTRGSSGRTTNSRDGLYRSETLMGMSQQGAAYVSSLVLGIA